MYSEMRLGIIVARLRMYRMDTAWLSNTIHPASTYKDTRLISAQRRFVLSLNLWMVGGNTGL